MRALTHPHHPVTRRGNFRAQGVKLFRPRDATAEVWRVPPGDETLLAGVAERDIGAFRVLCERHAAGTPVRAPVQRP